MFKPCNNCDGRLSGPYQSGRRHGNTSSGNGSRNWNRNRNRNITGTGTGNGNGAAGTAVMRQAARMVAALSGKTVI
jgi:hypothetical protein